MFSAHRVRRKNYKLKVEQNIQQIINMEIIMIKLCVMSLARNTISHIGIPLLEESKKLMT